jgi:homoserine O-succinyltransferase
MPINIQNDLPVKETLEKENLFVYDEKRADSQNIRPLQICILNLMPKKEDTELQLLRMLSNTPIQLDITFMRMSTHQSVHTSANHLHKFYYTFDDLKKRRFDGMIITGAPVEKLPYQEVDYWEELCRIFDWSRTHVWSTFHICWGAQAGVYYHYGLEKVMLPEKLCGVYMHKVFHRRNPLVRGFDDYFLIPHSRYTEVPAAALHACKELDILAESEKAGVLLCASCDLRKVFIFGHGEYDRYTLRDEYERDEREGLHPSLPQNYYPDDDPTKEPLLQWRSSSQALYSNWINYAVYQNTPYDINEIC